MGSCRLNAQAVRTAAQLCSGTGAVKPPTSASQAGIGQLGSFLPGGYIIVVCAIDSSGNYGESGQIRVYATVTLRQALEP